jgi:hypothetical protein
MRLTVTDSTQDMDLREWALVAQTWVVQGLMKHEGARKERK